MSQKLLRCHVGSAAYYLDLTRVAGIHRADALEALPDAAPSDPWVGTLPLPDADLPVLDLARRLGHSARPGGQVIALHAQPWAWGIRVERVAQVPPLTTPLQPLPSQVRTPGTAWVAGGAVAGDDLTLVLHPEGLQEDVATVDGTPDPEREDAPAVGTYREQLVVFGLAPSVEERPVRYGLQMRHIVEVLDRPQIRPLPGAPEHVLGLTAWRGRVLPVVDLRARLDGPVAEPAERSRVLVVWSGTTLTGLRVEADIQIVPLPVAHQPSERAVGAIAKLARGVVELQRMTLVVLDPVLCA